MPAVDSLNKINNMLVIRLVWKWWVKQKLIFGANHCHLIWKTFRIHATATHRKENSEAKEGQEEIIYQLCHKWKWIRHNFVPPAIRRSESIFHIVWIFCSSFFRSLIESEIKGYEGGKISGKKNGIPIKFGDTIKCSSSRRFMVIGKKKTIEKMCERPNLCDWTQTRTNALRNLGQQFKKADIPNRS